MDVIASFVPHAEAPELMQPRQRPLHDPAEDAQPAAMRGAPPRQDGRDAQSPQPIPMGLGVIAPIALHPVRSLTGATAPPLNRRDGLDQGHELRDVVRVRAGQATGQGEALAIRNDVMLAPQLPSIRWIRARFFPACRARTELESTMARDQSSWSA